MIQPGAASRTADPHRPQPPSDLLEGVLEALPVGIGLFDLIGERVEYRAGNREFQRVLQQEQPLRKGQSLNEVFARGQHDAVRRLFEQVQRRAEPQSYVATQASESQAQRLWNMDAYPVLSGGRVTQIMVLAEQSEEKIGAFQRQQHETERLREKAEQLEGLEKAKSEFLRLASHELRGPAAMLGGYLSMMEEEALGPIPERLRPVLPLLRAKAAQINMLANEMVEAARLEDRRLQLKRKRVNFADMARRACQAASASLSSGQRLRFEDRTDGPVAVLADPMRLDIIIANLIDNAIKYSPEGGDITVDLSIAGQFAILTVRDMGIGIAPEDMERLFIRFNRIAPRADVPGTGLGLYLARELARLHGGDIHAVSRLGEGSEFTLSLPLDTAGK